MRLAVRQNEGVKSLFKRALAKLDGREAIEFIKAYKALPEGDRDAMLTLLASYFTLEIK